MQLLIGGSSSKLIIHLVLNANKWLSARKIVSFKPYNHLARRSEIKIIILILEPITVDSSL